MSDNEQKQMVEFLKARNLGDAIDLQRELSQAESLSDYLDHAFNVCDVEFRQGREGEYCVMEVQSLRTQETFKLQTGAVVIMRIMRKLSEARALPVSCAFRKPANQNWYTIDDPKKSDF